MQTITVNANNLMLAQFDKVDIETAISEGMQAGWHLDVSVGLPAMLTAIEYPHPVSEKIFLIILMQNRKTYAKSSSTSQFQYFRCSILVSHAPSILIIYDLTYIVKNGDLIPFSHTGSNFYSSIK